MQLKVLKGLEKQTSQAKQSKRVGRVGGYGKVLRPRIGICPETFEDCSIDLALEFPGSGAE